MSSSLEYILPDFILYWQEVGLVKFVRVFWYFILFELTRYILLDYIVAGWYWLFRSERKRKWEEARRAFWNENPFVSVIIPGKNEGKHLFKLTKSLAEQTFQNFELIIVDDGSDDDTPIIGRNLQNDTVLREDSGDDFGILHLLDDSESEK